MKILSIGLLFLISCSLFENPEREKILKAWIGKSVSELEGHPFFSQIPLKRKEVKGDKEIRNYEQIGKYSSKARAGTLGDGLGLPSETCQNIFTIKKGIIQKYEMKESCLTDKRKMP